MALDEDEVAIFAGGAVYTAPVGTTGPTDIATALNASFTNLGYISEDGLEMTPSMEIMLVRAWQSRYPIRRNVQSRDLEFGFALMQWNEETIKLAFGGGSVAATVGPPAYYTYTPPDDDDAPFYRAVVIELEDGGKTYRWHIPKVLVTDVGALNFVATDPTALPLTFSLIQTAGVQPFTLITDDPSFASS